MAFAIQELDDRNFILNGDVYSKSFRAFADNDNILVVGDGAKINSITNGSNYVNFTTKDSSGVILYDGSAGDSIDDLVVSINSIVNFA